MRRIFTGRKNVDFAANVHGYKFILKQVNVRPGFFVNVPEVTARWEEAFFLFDFTLAVFCI